MPSMLCSKIEGKNHSYRVVLDAHRFVSAPRADRASLANSYSKNTEISEYINGVSA